MSNQINIREYQPGDPSKVSYFYFSLFTKQFNFKPISERYFMTSLLDLFQYKEGSQLWIVENNQEIVGTIGIVKQSETEAQLRWFGLDESLQGMGMGNKLMTLALDFCKEKGYSHIILWTIDILKPARHLYAKFGFTLTDTKINSEWSTSELIEEKWELNQKD